MKVFRKIWGGITSLMVAAVVILAILLVGVRLVGLTPYTVLSGSMEPAYHVGSLIYVKEAKPEEIQVGMPITFIVNEDLLIATHRVVDIRVMDTTSEPIRDANGQPITDEQGNALMKEVPLEEPAYYFQTKGDANETVDSTPVHYKNVVGRPVFSIPLLGYLSSWLQTRQGTIMGIAIALVLLIFTFLPDLLKWAEGKPNEASEKRTLTDGDSSDKAIKEKRTIIQRKETEKHAKER